MSVAGLQPLGLTATRERVASAVPVLKSRICADASREKRTVAVSMLSLFDLYVCLIRMEYYSHTLVTVSDYAKWCNVGKNQGAKQSENAQSTSSQFWGSTKESGKGFVPSNETAQLKPNHMEVYHVDVHILV
jgi:hypothetical protein